MTVFIYNLLHFKVQTKTKLNTKETQAITKTTVQCALLMHQLYVMCCILCREWLGNKYIIQIISQIPLQPNFQK